jgi:uncharacterized membrane protein
LCIKYIIVKKVLFFNGIIRLNQINWDSATFRKKIIIIIIIIIKISLDPGKTWIKTKTEAVLARNTCFYHESLSLLLSKFLLEGRKVLVGAIFVMLSALVNSSPCRWGFYERAVFSLVSFFWFWQRKHPLWCCFFYCDPASDV